MTSTPSPKMKFQVPVDMQMYVAGLTDRHLRALQEFFALLIFIIHATGLLFNFSLFYLIKSLQKKRVPETLK
jgi:hypothetical protein